MQAVLLPELVALERYAEQGLVKDARALYRKVGSAFPDEQRALMEEAVFLAYSKAADFAGAAAWFEHMRHRGVTLNDKLFGSLLDEAIAKEKVGDTLEYLQRAGLTLDVPKFSAAIIAFFKVGAVEKASMWLQHARDTNVALSKDAYQAVIALCSVRGLPEQAASALEAMVFAGHVPKVDSTNAVLAAYARVGDKEGAMKWLEMMESSGLRFDKNTFNSAISLYANVGNVEGAEEWFDKLVKAGFQADEESYAAMMRVCARNSDVDGVQSWLAKQEEAGFNKTQAAFKAQVEVYARCGDIEEAARKLEELKAEGHVPSRSCYAALMGARARERNPDEAMRWFTEMLEVGHKPKAAHYDILLQVMAATGQQNEVRILMDRMSHRLCRPGMTTFAILIEAAVDDLDKERAFMYLNRLKQAGHVPDNRIFRTLFRVCAEVRPVDQKSAKRLVDEMRRERVTPDEETYEEMRKALGDTPAYHLANTLAAELRGETWEDPRKSKWEKKERERLQQRGDIDYVTTSRSAAAARYTAAERGVDVRRLSKLPESAAETGERPGWATPVPRKKADWMPLMQTDKYDRNKERRFATQRLRKKLDRQKRKWQH